MCCLLTWFARTRREGARRMLLCRRLWLYQSTHSRVANSTWSSVFHGPRRLISSVLIEPDRRLREGVVVPIADGPDRGIGAGVDRPCVTAKLVYWLPASECAIRPLPGLADGGVLGPERHLQRVEHQARFSSFVSAFQPTIRRLNASIVERRHRGSVRSSVCGWGDRSGLCGGPGPERAVGERRFWAGRGPERTPDEYADHEVQDGHEAGW